MPVLLSLCEVGPVSDTFSLSLKIFVLIELTFTSIFNYKNCGINFHRLSADKKIVLPIYSKLISNANELL